MALAQKTKVLNKNVELKDPPFARYLFNTTGTAAVIWLLLRLYVGYQWLTSGWGKINNENWVGTGAALKNYWTNAVRIPEAPARPPITFDWYRGFLQYLLDIEAHTWFAKLIAYGEVLVGIALILGLFTGIAAFFGGFMNWNFMMAGSASTNPLLFTISIGLILAWKVAGYYGLDRFVLPALGTPWQIAPLFRDEPVASAAEEAGPASGAAARLGTA